MWRVWVRRGGCIGSWWGNWREGDHWGDLGVDGWIILGWIEKNELGMWRVWVMRGWCIGSWWGNRRERDQWGDLDVDEWIILRWNSRRWDLGIWTGLGWPRIERWRKLVSAVMKLRGSGVFACEN